MISAACRLLIVRCGIDSKDKALQKAISGCFLERFVYI